MRAFGIFGLNSQLNPRACGRARTRRSCRIGVRWELDCVEDTGESSYGAGHATFLYIGIGAEAVLPTLTLDLADGRSLTLDNLETRRILTVE